MSHVNATFHPSSTTPSSGVAHPPLPVLSPFPVLTWTTGCRASKAHCPQSALAQLSRGEVAAAVLARLIGRISNRLLLPFPWKKPPVVSTGSYRTRSGCFPHHCCRRRKGLWDLGQHPPPQHPHPQRRIHWAPEPAVRTWALLQTSPHRANPEAGLTAAATTQEL